MKRYFMSVLVLFTVALMASSYAQAGSEEKVIIALKTDDFELAETDISDLAVGESQTFETDSGKIIDLLRTTDGVEVYVDGELQEMDFSEEGLHASHAMKKHIEIVCDSDEDCDENVFIMAGDHDDATSWVTQDGHNVFVHKEIEISCNDDDEDANCSENMLWISDDGDIDLEALHELHTDGDSDAHRVIVIKKHVDTEN